MKSHFCVFFRVFYPSHCKPITSDTSDKLTFWDQRNLDSRLKQLSYLYIVQFLFFIEINILVVPDALDKANAGLLTQPFQSFTGVKYVGFNWSLLPQGIDPFQKRLFIYSTRRIFFGNLMRANRPEISGSPDVPVEPDGAFAEVRSSVRKTTYKSSS
jgi:hypothetical protein